MIAYALIASLGLGVSGASAGGSAALGRSVAASTPTTIAVAPLVTERVGLDELDLYRRLDEALRTGARSLPDISLQDASTTSQTINELQQAGLTCDAEDAPCLGKVAVLAGVSRLVVPTVRRSRDLFSIRLLVVDGSGAAIMIDGVVPLTTQGKAGFPKQATRALMERAVAEPIGATAAPAAAVAPAADTGPTSEDAAPRPTPWLGIGVISAGGALALAGGAGAVASELALGTPAPFEVRAPSIIAGQLSVAVVAVGLAAAGVGTYLVLSEP